MAVEDPAREVPQPDRRSSPRVITVYRPVLLEAGEFIGFCLVRNISAGGLKGTIYASLLEGQSVCIEFHPDLKMTGRVVWQRDQQVGIAFDEEVEVRFLVTQMSLKYSGTKTNRAPRIPFACKGAVGVGESTVPIKLVDISQAGAKISGPRIEPGEEIVVQFENFEPRKAVVVWSRGRDMGLNFLRAIPFDELACWVFDQQGKQQVS